MYSVLCTPELVPKWFMLPGKNITSENGFNRDAYSLTLTTRFTINLRPNRSRPGQILTSFISIFFFRFFRPFFFKASTHVYIWIFNLGHASLLKRVWPSVRRSVGPGKSIFSMRWAPEWAMQSIMRIFAFSFFSTIFTTVAFTTVAGATTTTINNLPAIIKTRPSRPMMHPWAY